ncbi:MAG: DUF2007 domain-containing protein [Flavobacteriales bacterium]|nr:DUF2007 domain-containing protein [Flavobacteriales bacterium]
MSREYVNIFTGSSILTTRIKHLLEETGITSIVKDHMESGRLAGFGTPMNSVQLFVLEKDLDEAKHVVANFEKEIES